MRKNNSQVIGFKGFLLTIHWETWRVEAKKKTLVVTLKSLLGKLLYKKLLVTVIVTSESNLSYFKIYFSYPPPPSPNFLIRKDWNEIIFFLYKMKNTQCSDKWIIYFSTMVDIEELCVTWPRYQIFLMFFLEFNQIQPLNKQNYSFVRLYFCRALSVFFQIWFWIYI